MSKQGLADLLLTEGGRERSGGESDRAVQNGVAEEGGRMGEGPLAVAEDSWQDELRSLFPNANISFGGGGTHTHTHWLVLIIP